jgi:CRISPR system Cascade subunit CasD
MTQYLLFTLAAPLASFGAVAVGEHRPTWDRPSKSQAIGIVASALGIERIDEARQHALATGLGFAVRIDDPGQLASDYHTAQTAKDIEIRRRSKTHGPIRTRADELSCDDLKTILSQREFRAGSLYTIALWRTQAGDPSLEKIATALRAPAFVPYAGRKAHALMLPMAPRVISADRVETAFTDFDKEIPAPLADLRCDLERQSRGRPPAIYADASSIPKDQVDERVSRLEERRDVPESRAKWRFGLRTEALLRNPATEGDAS